MRRVAVYINPPEESLENPKSCPIPENVTGCARRTAPLGVVRVAGARSVNYCGVAQKLRQWQHRWDRRASALNQPVTPARSTGGYRVAGYMVLSVSSLNPGLSLPWNVAPHVTSNRQAADVCQGDAPVGIIVGIGSVNRRQHTDI